MTEVLQAAMTPPTSNGDAPLPKRVGARTMLPGSWVSRSVRVAYVDAHGGGRETTGALLDWCSMGPVFSLSGEKTVLAWDSLRSVTLIND
jgi:hypothetical protein